MRGKHGKSSAARRRQGLLDDLAAARAELADERKLLAGIAAEEAEIEVLDERLISALTIRQRGTAAEVAALLQEERTVIPLLRRAEDLDKALDDHWQHLHDDCVTLLGGDIRAIEWWQRIVGHARGAQMTPRLRKLGTFRAQQLQIARGVRRGVTVSIDPNEPEPDGPLHGLYHPSIDELFDRRVEDGTPVPPEVITASEVVNWAGWSTTSRDAIYTWHPFPWTADSVEPHPGTEHPTAAALGFTASARGRKAPPSPESSGLFDAGPSAAMTQSRREQIAASDPKVVIGRWAEHLKTPKIVSERLPNPFVAQPLHSRAVDAVCARHWYVRSSMGMWSRGHAHDPDLGFAYGEVAVAMAAAPTYWLPPTQTFDLLDSEPITDTEDLRLPFAQVFLAFAEPPRLPATWTIDPPDTDESPEAEALRQARRDADILETALMTLREPSPLAVLDLYLTGDAEHDYPHGERPLNASVWDALAVRGATVEGLLLLGDALGNLSPYAAWAVSVPSKRPGLTLGRHLIPMRWDASPWRGQVLNAAAAVAWADWHEPVDPLGGEDAHDGPRTDRSAHLGDVRVLAVRRTKAQDHDSTPTGRTMASHPRRGHWRRQHHGPRGELVKRVRIAPTIVNADRRGFTSRVYTLPSLN